MAFIIAAGTSVPRHAARQSEVKEQVQRMFHGRLPHLDKLIRVFDNSGIDTRYFCEPLERYNAPFSIEESHQLYVRHAVELAREAVEQCLERASLKAEQVDHIIVVSTTGVATPSIDARLFGVLPFRSNTKRTPIWGLGCAGGAAGISRAFEYVRAFPEHRCLVVAVELCSLTFIPGDLTKSNLVASCLFGDGAAAVLLVGERVHGSSRGLHVLDTLSTLWPDSLDVMGWEMTNEGMKVVFSRDIPAIVLQEMDGIVRSLVQRSGLTPSDIRHYILHPGGAKVLAAYEEALGLSDGRERFAAAFEVLQNYGNMSSATVYFVLERMLRTMAGIPGYGIIGALGPGFSSEVLLVENQ